MLKLCLKPSVPPFCGAEPLPVIWHCPCLVSCLMDSFSFDSGQWRDLVCLLQICCTVQTGSGWKFQPCWCISFPKKQPEERTFVFQSFKKWKLGDKTFLCAVKTTEVLLLVVVLWKISSALSANQCCAGLHITVHMPQLFVEDINVQCSMKTYQIVYMFTCSWCVAGAAILSNTSQIEFLLSCYTENAPKRFMGRGNDHPCWWDTKLQVACCAVGDSQQHTRSRNSSAGLLQVQLSLSWWWGSLGRLKKLEAFWTRLGFVFFFFFYPPWLSW